MISLTQDSILVRPQETIATEIDREIIVMDIEAGSYYGLEGPARSVWEALSAPISFRELLDKISGEYEIDLATCSEDVRVFLLELAQEGLLHVE